MKASELVKLLNEKIAEHGDLEVSITDGGLAAISYFCNKGNIE